MLKRIKRLRLRRPSVGVIGRRLHGLIRSCEKCGASRQELFRMHTFSKTGAGKVQYYCKHCYARMLRRPKEI